MADVLGNAEIMRMICSFQCGIYGDIAPCIPPLNAQQFEPLQAIFTPLYREKSVKMLDRLMECKPDMLESLVRYAVWSEQADILVHLNRLHDIRSMGGLLDFAAGYSSLEMVEWLHVHDFTGCSYRAMNAAAERGHLEIVKFLHTNRQEGCSRSAMNGAMKNGHLSVVEFLHQHRREGCTPYGMDIAAKNGHLEVIRFLHNNRTEGCTADALNWAAEAGHLDVVKFLHEMRQEGYAPWAIEAARASNQWRVVEYLEKHPKEDQEYAAYDDTDLVFSGRDFDF